MKLEVFLTPVMEAIFDATARERSGLTGHALQTGTVAASTSYQSLLALSATRFATRLGLRILALRDSAMHVLALVTGEEIQAAGERLLAPAA